MAMTGLIFMISSISIACAALLYDCPEPEEMTSCTCRWLFAPVVYCNNIKKQSDLLSNLNVLKGYATKQLTLSEVEISSVSESLFNGLNVKQLILSNFEVIDDSPTLGQFPFAGLENSLEELEIKNSFNKNKLLLNLKLNHLKFLKIGLFEDSIIPTIGNDCFDNGPKTLTMLQFERCEIEKLGNKVFQSLDNLMFLTVAANRVSYISRSMFPSPAKRLMKLDLQYNKIKELPMDLFSGMPSLSEINLSDNLLHILHEEMFSSTILHLGRLYFDGNPLDCNNDLKWLCKSRFDVVVAKCLTPVDKKGLSVHQFCQKG